jgi:hypothetical protein
MLGEQQLDRYWPVEHGIMRSPNLAVTASTNAPL